MWGWEEAGGPAGVGTGLVAGCRERGCGLGLAGIHLLQDIVQQGFISRKMETAAAFCIRGKL